MPALFVVTAAAAVVIHCVSLTIRTNQVHRMDYAVFKPTLGGHYLAYRERRVSLMVTTSLDQHASAAIIEDKTVAIGLD